MKHFLPMLLSLLACIDPQVADSQREAMRIDEETRSENTLRQAVQESFCLAPTGSEVAQMKKNLLDFVVIRGEPQHLLATFPTAEELEDLAYFMVAVAEESREMRGYGDRLGSLAEKDSERELSRNRLFSSLKQSYPDLLINQQEEDGPEETWSHSNSPESEEEPVRALVWALFEAGRCAEATALYQVSYSPEEKRSQFIRASISCEERQQHCRGTVSARLASINMPASDPDNLYGPQRLAAAGFDVHRLYRGAWLTAFRDMDSLQLKALFEKSPAPMRAAALSRLAKNGPEAWEFRVRALEGLADLEQKLSIERLMQVVRVRQLSVEYPVSSSPTIRSIDILTALTSRPWADPCKMAPEKVEAFVSSVGAERDERNILVLSKCGEVLDFNEREQLAKRVLMELEDSMNAKPKCHCRFESRLLDALTELDAIGSVAPLLRMKKNADLVQQQVCDFTRAGFVGDKDIAVTCSRARNWSSSLADAIDMIKEVEAAWNTH